MNTRFLQILLVTLAVQLQAQVHQGLVRDVNSNEPIPGAHILVNGTTIGAACDENGIFDLKGFPKPPFRVRVSAVGYETSVVEVFRIPEYGMILFLLEPITLSEATIKAQRVVIPGCNIDIPGFGWDLGVVDRGGERVIVREARTILGRNFSQTWSDPVTASKCQKMMFDGGSKNDYNADCRSNPAGYRGDFFSWCAVMRYKDVLCPEPWRVPTNEDFAKLSNALCGNSEGSYHIFPQLTRRCHTEFLSTWGGLHHGFCDPSGNVYEQGRLAYYWEILDFNIGTWTEYEEHNEFTFDKSAGAWQTYEEPVYRSGSAVYNWDMLPMGNYIWRVIALDKIHDKGEIVYNLEHGDSYWTVEKHRESNAVYYWSQSTEGTWKANVLGLSADRDPAYNPRRQRNRDKHRWGYYSVLPQLIMDKDYGLTLRCVKD